MHQLRVITNPAATDAMACRPGCGACCIAPSISSALPGMPGGKPAGVRCVNLNDRNLCTLWGTPQLPTVCRSIRPTLDMCGSDAAEAMTNLAIMESLTQPA